MLFIGAGIIDFYQEIKDPFNLISNYYQQLNGYIPPRWEKDNLRSLFKYCFKKKYLRKESNLQKCKFILSQKGINKLKINYPFYFYSLKNWDKKLRLVIFDIKEIDKDKRNFLRRFLKQLGFIMIQKSLWLSPFNQFPILKKWLRENLTNENIILIEAEKINIKNKNKILNKFWRKKL